MPTTSASTAIAPPTAPMIVFRVATFFVDLDSSGLGAEGAVFELAGPGDIDDGGGVLFWLLDPINKDKERS